MPRDENAFVLLEPTRDEFRKIAQALAAGFDDGPMFGWCVPERRRRARWVAFLMEHILHSTATVGHVWVAIHAEDQTVAGAVAIVHSNRFPFPLRTQLATTARLLAHPGLRAVYPNEFVRTMRVFGRMQKLHYRPEHWYVPVISLHPNAQGCGLGRRLMKCATEVADRDGVPIYLETTNERALSFYRSCGLEPIDTVEPMPGCPPMWLLLRDNMRS